MGYIKFTTVKLIVFYLTLISLTHFVFSENCEAAPKYVVQVAASKSPINIRDFSKRNEIYDEIVEIKSDIWVRYFVGSFDNYKAATEFASEILNKTKLTNVFVRLLDDYPGNMEVEAKDLPSALSQSGERNESITSNIPSGQTDTLNHPLNTNEIKDNQDSVVPKTVMEQKNELQTIKQKKVKSERLKLDNNWLNSFFTEEQIKTFKKAIIEHANNHVPRNIRKFYLLVVEKSFQYPVIIIFIALILFFIVNIIGVFLILNYSVKRKLNKTRYIEIYSKMYEDVLMLYLFGSINWEQLIIKLKKIERKVNRRILISILLNFHENLKGEVDKFIPEIYVKLGLHADSIKSANSIFTYRKVQGIRELTFLYSEGAIGLVSGLINHPNSIIRSEAQIAYVRLNPNNPFKFLNSLTKPFSRWTQIASFYLLRLHQLPIPSFTNFLYSKHYNVRNFSLKMITYFQQLENISEIFNMLESKMERTRYLAYKAINDLRLNDGRITIKNKFRYETKKNREEIVKAFRNIGTSEDFDFLKIIIRSETDTLKLEACRSMYFMNEEGKEKLLKMNEESGNELEVFIAHITDPRN